jgi:hypothetical protein
MTTSPWLNDSASQDGAFFLISLSRSIGRSARDLNHTRIKLVVAASRAAQCDWTCNSDFRIVEPISGLTGIDAPARLATRKVPMQWIV